MNPTIQVIYIGGSSFFLIKPGGRSRLDKFLFEGHVLTFLSTPLGDRSWLIWVGPELASVQKSLKRLNMGPERFIIALSILLGVRERIVGRCLVSCACFPVV